MAWIYETYVDKIDIFLIQYFIFLKVKLFETK